MYVSPPRFTEDNDARPTYALTTLTVFLLVVDHIIQLTKGPHSRGLYMLAVLVSMTAGISAVYCIMGCIWHPIPKELRAAGGMTSLQLKAAETKNRSRFTSTEDTIEVDANQAEMRPRIQWAKLCLVLSSVGLTFCLMILWNH